MHTIAIDHMKSDIALVARPVGGGPSGTDGALALGMIRTMINERLYDREFVEKLHVVRGAEGVCPVVHAGSPLHRPPA